MHAVILTFPGHFYQTHLTVRSLLRYYPEIAQISFFLDDVQQGPWTQYIGDFDSSIGLVCPIAYDIHPVSEIWLMSQCVAGWWRQQLVKLTLDQILPHTEWFVVDGDVIFGTRCEVRRSVPITRFGDNKSPWGLMCANYVQGLLGTELGCIRDQDQQVATSPIPFRYLDRDTLSGLRQHVENRYQRDFVQAHLAWFQDQTIVANWDPPVRWVMSEWELIECYRRYVLDQSWPLIDIGSGYGIDCEIRDGFHHTYQRDTEMSWQIFPTRGQQIDPVIWARAQAWYDQVERPHRR
jgi:hypothetical protein